jgi:hypothetical protein
MPVCDGCALLDSCPYSIVFETSAIPEEFTVLRNYPRAPHPFVVVPPLDAAVTKRASFRLFNWDRMSTRQGPKVQMDGVLGSVAAEGDLTDLAPSFRTREWVNIGSGTSMGMGRYTLTTD